MDSGALEDTLNKHTQLWASEQAHRTQKAACRFIQLCLAVWRAGCYRGCTSFPDPGGGADGGQSHGGGT